MSDDQKTDEPHGSWTIPDFSTDGPHQSIQAKQRGIGYNGKKEIRHSIHNVQGYGTQGRQPMKKIQRRTSSIGRSLSPVKSSLSSSRSISRSLSPDVTRTTKSDENTKNNVDFIPKSTHITSHLMNHTATHITVDNILPKSNLLSSHISNQDSLDISVDSLSKPSKSDNTIELTVGNTV